MKKVNKDYKKACERNQNRSKKEKEKKATTWSGTLEKALRR